MVCARAERPAVGLLADERDRSGAELEGDAPEPVGRIREVGTTQVARPGGRAGGRVRRADAVVEQLELLARLEQPRREPRVVEQAPEIVARVGEVSVCCRRHAARVDAAEDNLEAGREHVRNRALRWCKVDAIAFPTRHDVLVTIAVGRRLGVPGRDTPGLGGGSRLVAVRGRLRWNGLHQGASYSIVRGLPLLEPRLEREPKILTRHAAEQARPTRLDLDGEHALIAFAVTPRVSLGFTQRAQPHEGHRTPFPTAQSKIHSPVDG